MEQTNKKWLQVVSSAEGHYLGTFFCDASDLEIPPGTNPNTVQVLDPWDRRVDVDFVTQRKFGGVVGWQAVILSPKEEWVTLVIAND